MSPVLIAGSGIVTLALVFYSIAYFRFHRSKQIDRKLLTIQTLGLLFDLTATTLMIIGSSNSPFTLHGMLGYSALTVMIIDTVIFWSNRRSGFSRNINIYSSVAYVWWVLAYLTGSMLAFIS